MKLLLLMGLIGHILQGILCLYQQVPGITYGIPDQNL